MTCPRIYGVIEKPELVLGKVEVVSDMCAAQERKSPVVNARKARCQNFESNFIWRRGRRRKRRWRKAGRQWGRDLRDDDRPPRRETYCACRADGIRAPRVVLSCQRETVPRRHARIAPTKASPDSSGKLRAHRIKRTTSAA